MYIQQIEDLLIRFWSTLKSEREKKKNQKKPHRHSPFPQYREDASCAFMANQPRDVVERFYSEKGRENHEQENQKTQLLYNRDKAWCLLAGLIFSLYEEDFPGERRQGRGGVKLL